MSPKPESHIQLSVSLSPDTVSLSALEKPLTINVTAKTLSSSRPSSAICLNARWTALDNRAGLLKGAFLLRNSSDPSIIIPLGPAVKVAYSGAPGNPDLRHNDFERFVVVPGVDEGELNICHEISGERIFQYSRQVKPSDIALGTEFRLELQTSKLPAFWWTFEDEAEGKKFYEGILPDENGLHGLKDDDPEAIEKLYGEGWLYSYPLSDLSFTVAKNSEAVIRFVE